MNVSDRFPGLQRRTGRRKSTPTSPTSPLFDIRSGRPHDIPVLSPIERNSNISYTPVDSPSIDLTVPSPTFDLASISPALAQQSNSTDQYSRDTIATNHGPAPRVSKRDENVRSPAAISGLWPTTATANTMIKTLPTHSPEPSKDSPSMNSQHTSTEVPKRPSSRGKDDGATARANAFWAQYGSAEENSAPKQSITSRRSRFNLLNPITLLARRRSSQNPNRADEEILNVTSLHVPAIPDNITASIRGTVVHDFSAPRLKRNHTDNLVRPGSGPSPAYPRRPSEYPTPPTEYSVGTPSSLHSPMFKEHFQEESRTVQPTNTSYLHAQSLQAPHSADMPSFAKKLPVTLPVGDAVAVEPSDNDLQKQDIQTPTLPTEPEVSPPPPPPPPKEDVSTAFEVPVKSAIPKHMASTSSRFSFIGQQGSIAQEKLLENKHKDVPVKAPAKVRFSADSFGDMDDYDDFDGYDDDDGGFDNDAIEIKNVDMPSSQLPTQNIPTVVYNNFGGNSYDDFGEEDDEFGTGDIEIKNIDLPTSQTRLSNTDDIEPLDDAEGSLVDIHNIALPPSLNTHRDSLQAFHFTPQSLTFSPTVTHYTSQSTPRDGEGLPIGMAESREAGRVSLPRIRDSSDNFYDGLGISTDETDTEEAVKLNKTSSQLFDDFDMYIDDGEFDDQIVEANGEFDEEDLDDPTRIKDIPAENERKYQAAVGRKESSDPSSGMVSGSQNGVSRDIPRPLFMRAESPETTFGQPPNLQDGLTEVNLAAHHDALASALLKATANGAVNRSLSFGRQSEDETDSGYRDSAPGISSHGSRYSNNMISSGISDEGDGYGYDDNDDFDDEAMIAAANAEALENDDDGFYGQEFGFYARAHGRDTGDMVSGGYFTSRGSNGVKRSHSGKNNFQEPSLTPITERSEWSTRNSIASLPPHAGLPGGLPMSSPGIAQLLERDSPLAEDEMSVSNLMKMRAKAFGGSSSSLNSLTDRHQPQGSSPLAHVAGYRMFPTDGRASSPAGMLHKHLNIVESEEEEDDRTGDRRTLTQNTPMKTATEPKRDTSSSSREQDVPGSPISRKGNHSRNSSGAESVSYARESDGRWVLERRRTGDAGELELIGREYLAGARI